MQRRSHKLLASRLLAETDGFSARRYNWAFLFGSIEPDCNPLSYLKGTFRAHRFQGHHFSNSGRFIERHILRLQSRSSWTIWQYYTLGKLTHYIADAYTYPHNENYRDSLLEHRHYEEELRTRLQEFLDTDPDATPEAMTALLEHAGVHASLCFVQSDMHADVNAGMHAATISNADTDAGTDSNADSNPDAANRAVWAARQAALAEHAALMRQAALAGQMPLQPFQVTIQMTLIEALRSLHEEYMAGDAGLQQDCRYILAASRLLMCQCEPAGKQDSVWVSVHSLQSVESTVRNSVWISRMSRVARVCLAARMAH